MNPPTPPLSHATEIDSIEAGRPRPWDAAPQAELLPLRGVLTDIDDTLTRDGCIEPAALAALRQLDDAGWPVIAVTGRPAGWSEPGLRDWPVRAIVAENGGVLLQRSAGGAVAMSFTVDDSERARRGSRLHACAEAIERGVPAARRALDSSGRLTDIAIDHSEHHHLAAADIAAVVDCMRRHGLNATVSSIHVNGWLGDHDKWTGAAWAVQQVLGWRFDPAEWIYVGDSANDQLMFERVPVSVGVANIAPLLPQLRAAPAWMTRAERGQGFAQVAQRLLDTGRMR